VSALPFELIVNLPNKPGNLAAAAGAIGRVNVNVLAFAAVATGKSDEVRFLVDDPDTAETALKEAGYKFRRLEVLAVPASNTPGELAALSERLAKAGINIDGGYLAARNDGRLEMIFEVSDLSGARKALKL
jgi:hypothetical protein